MVIYCASCAKKAEYTAVKPVYCAACGQPYDAAFARAKPVVAKVRPTRQEVVDDVDEDDEEEDDVYTPPVRGHRKLSTSCVKINVGGHLKARDLQGFGPIERGNQTNAPQSSAGIEVTKGSSAEHLDNLMKLANAKAKQS